MKENNPEIAYRVTKIYTAAFSFEEISPKEAEQIFDKDSSPGLNLNIEIKDNKEENTLTLQVQSEFQEKGSLTFVKHTGTTVFEIKNMESLYDKEDKYSLKLPDDLLVQFFGLAYSHARALLAMEISPTVYKDKFILPVVNPTDFIPNSENG